MAPRTFDADGIAHFEMAGWWAYYDREWGKLLRMTVGLCQTQFGIPFPLSLKAKEFLEEMRERFRKFNLELHEEKTRLIEFGRNAANHCRHRGRGKPETFDFLGFTHICGINRRSGGFTVRRQTKKKKQRAKLKQLYQEMREKMHEPIPMVGAWLKSVVRGHYQYYGVPLNSPALSKFRHEVARLWLQVLRRRGQKISLTWKRMKRLESLWLPAPRIYHPYPSQRLRIRPAIRT